MPNPQRYHPPESQDVDYLSTQMRDEADAASQPSDMTEARKRIIKARLRVFQKQANDSNARYATVPIATVERQVEETNEEFKKFRYGPKNTRAANPVDASLAVIDSRVMGTHADTAAKMGKLARSSANSFEEEDFFDPLRRLLGLEIGLLEDVDEEEGYNVRRGGRLGDWAKIGWMASKRSQRAPAVEFMNGMMAVEHTRRIVKRKARQKQVVQPEVRPQEIRQEDMKQAINPTIANTEAIEKLLVKQPGDGKVNLFKWLINPRSFGQTIENTFWTSFLISTGGAAVVDAEDGSGIPLIFACDPPTEEDRRQRDFDNDGNDIGPMLRKRQVILEMTMEIWQEAIELFDIRESLIPHRIEEAPAEPGREGWYA